MSVTVPLEELRNELGRRSGTVYLLTVSERGRPHCVAASVGWNGDELEIRTGTSSAHNAQARPGVTLLAPPQPPSAEEQEAPADSPDMREYSLIVDGDATTIATAPTGGGVVRVRPIHAVFHRPAEGPSGEHAHDCVPVFDHVQDAPTT